MEAFPAYGIGAAGVILAVIVVPTIRWLLKELTAQRKSFYEFVTEHSDREVVVMTKIEETLGRLVDRVEKSS